MPMNRVKRHLLNPSASDSLVVCAVRNHLFHLTRPRPFTYFSCILSPLTREKTLLFHHGETLRCYVPPNGGKL